MESPGAHAVIESGSALLETILTDGTKSFGKAFLLYFLPMTVLKRKLQKKILLRALSIAGFMGMAKITTSTISLQGESSTRYAKAISGAIGASFALTIDPSLRFNTLVIWLTIRAVRQWMEEYEWGRKILNIPHLDVAWMCFGSCQIISAWARHPYELDRDYLKFLYLHGGRDPTTMKTFSREVTGPIANSFPEVIKAVRGHNVSYTQDMIRFFIAGMKRSFKVYGPLYLVALCYGLVKSKSITGDLVKKLMRNYVSNTLFSSLFLTMYCWLSWMTFPLVKVVSSKASLDFGISRKNLQKHTWMGGLATLLERKERRPELAHYCVTYALDVLWTRMKNARPVLGKAEPYIGTVLFVGACSIMMHYDNKQPSLISTWILDNGAKKSPVKSVEISDSDKEKLWEPRP